MIVIKGETLIGHSSDTVSDSDCIIMCRYEIRNDDCMINKNVCHYSAYGNVYLRNVIDDACIIM